MARRAIPMIAFHGVYIYIYILVSTCASMRSFKEVASFPGARSIEGRGA